MKRFLSFAALVLLVPMAALHAADAPPAKPNIVFILADDLGWKDLGCYGSYAYHTPNIDRLAAEGVRFTRAHAYPSCSPTRSGVMTGMDPARLGITTISANVFCESCAVLERRESDGGVELRRAGGQFAATGEGPPSSGAAVRWRAGLGGA